MERFPETIPCWYDLVITREVLFFLFPNFCLFPLQNKGKKWGGGGVISGHWAFDSQLPFSTKKKESCQLSSTFLYLSQEVLICLHIIQLRFITFKTLISMEEINPVLKSLPLESRGFQIAWLYSWYLDKCHKKE